MKITTENLIEQNQPLIDRSDEIVIEMSESKDENNQIFLDRLPIDVIYHILSNLNLGDLVRSNRVNKNLHKASKAYFNYIFSLSNGHKYPNDSKKIHLILAEIKKLHSNLLAMNKRINHLARIAESTVAKSFVYSSRYLATSTRQLSNALLSNDIKSGDKFTNLVLIQIRIFTLLLLLSTLAGAATALYYNVEWFKEYLAKEGDKPSPNDSNETNKQDVTIYLLEAFFFLIAGLVGGACGFLAGFVIGALPTLLLSMPIQLLGLVGEKIVNQLNKYHKNLLDSRSNINCKFNELFENELKPLYEEKRLNFSNMNSLFSNTKTLAITLNPKARHRL